METFSEEETTLMELSNNKPVSGKRKAATFNTSVPFNVKVPKINKYVKVKTGNDDVKMKDEIKDIKEGITIEKVNKY